jgi:hypothetical protein
MERKISYQAADGKWYDLTVYDLIDSANEETEKLINNLIKETDKQQQWINDLQSRMYINCVYCGHRYGPKDEAPSSMADVLKEHIENCSDHPMSKLKKEYEDFKRDCR